MEGGREGGMYGRMCMYVYVYVFLSLLFILRTFVQLSAHGRLYELASPVLMLYLFRDCMYICLLLMLAGERQGLDDTGDVSEPGAGSQHNQPRNEVH